MKRIAPDKWKHFFVGIGMGGFLQVAGLMLLPAQAVLVAIIVLLLSAAISYGFELFSLFTGRGHYEVLDAVASVAGAMFGIAAVFIFLWLRTR